MNTGRFSFTNWGIILLIVFAGLCLPGFAAQSAARPNILWIIVDDMSPNFSSYGEKTITTPHVDRMAREGIRFSNAFVTAPVCSPCRSALITGMYQTSIGAHHHRSGRGDLKINLPGGVEPVPRIFQRAGYFTANMTWPPGNAEAKTDYNFEWPREMYNGKDWRQRLPGQPFFAQVQLPGGKLRDGGGLRPAVKKALKSLTEAESIKLPPYYPDDPIIRADWAAYLDACRYTDMQVGEILERLRQDGLETNTVVFFMTDHGISHARGKQFLYDEGLRVPLVVKGPGLPKGTVRSDLVEHIDLAATSLALAGIPLPAKMQAKDLLAAGYQAREMVFAARDRCDETVEGIRSLRTERFKYIRNFYPSRPHLQPNRYKDGKPTLRRLRELHAEKKLQEPVESLLFAQTRSAEELYDLKNDPHELVNLAAEESHRSTVLELRAKLERWMTEIGDVGRLPESEERYDSDMAVYLNETRAPAARTALEENIALMKKWAKEKPFQRSAGPSAP